MEEQCFGVLVLNVELTKQDLFQIQVEKDYYLEKKSPFKGMPILGDII